MTTDETLPPGVILAALVVGVGVFLLTFAFTMFVWTVVTGWTP